MFFNEDGDLAHEFYEETRTSKGTTMKRNLNLIPQVCYVQFIWRSKFQRTHVKWTHTVIFETYVL